MDHIHDLQGPKRQSLARNLWTRRNILPVAALFTFLGLGTIYVTIGEFEAWRLSKPTTGIDTTQLDPLNAIPPAQFSDPITRQNDTLPIDRETSNDPIREAIDSGTESEGDDKSTHKYIEVLANNYNPKSASMPSWLPKSAAQRPSEMTSESRKILDSNERVSAYTRETDKDALLILTPVKNNEKHLPRYFALLDKLKYPREKISLAFLVSDSTDNTQKMLVESLQWYQEKAPEEMRFRRFEIYREDFFYSLERNQRHLAEKQRERRTMMARARNYLWTRALKDEQWVLWIDGDLDYYPPNIVRDLMAYDKDVIVPNCLVRKKGANGQWKHNVYDRNAWQETAASLRMIKGLRDDDFLVEGYKTIRTYRKYLDNFSRNNTVVPLDGVGGTFTLVKAHVHRSGVGFPTWLFQHQVETEGFAKLAKANGFGVYGLPFYFIRHVVG